MKMRLIKMTPEFLIERLDGETSSLKTNLPSDVELVDIKYDAFSGQVLAIVRSDNFEDIMEAYPIPEFKLVYSANPKIGSATQPQVESTSKIEPKKAETKSEPELNKPASPSPKRNTGLIEEEFTDEQRRLLSFSVEGEFVIVKPVKFLKAEWDDINDTVRSLGGRWIKGDIISYWEIPWSQS